MKTFQDLYNELPDKEVKKTPREVFINQIAALTKRAPGTVKQWAYGNQKPDALAQSILEEHFGIPASQLFPSDENGDS